MSTAPDSISFEDLADFMMDAQKEDEMLDKEAHLFDGRTSDEVSEIVKDKLSEMSDSVNHPIVHKLAACEIIHSLMTWHNIASERLTEDGAHEAAKGWARDAGKFQAIMNILVSIQVCDDDFTCVNCK